MVLDGEALSGGDSREGVSERVWCEMAEAGLPFIGVGGARERAAGDVMEVVMAPVTRIEGAALRE